MAAANYYSAVQKAYIAFYGRPADKVGLEYWAGQLNTANGNLSTIINAFGTSTEALALFGSQTQTVAVNSLYQQLFGRSADVEGLVYYGTELAAGRMTLVNIAQRIADGATGDDATIIANKLTVAQSFTDAMDSADEILNYQGTAAATLARTFLSGVTADTATVTTATAAIPATLTSVATAGSATTSAGSTFTLTTSSDTTLTGGTGIDTFNGIASDTSASTDTFNTTDSLDGGAGADILNITLTGTTAATTLAPAQVSNIETINVRALQTTAATVTTVAASNYTGVTAFNADRASSALTFSSLSQGTEIGMVGNLVTTNGNLIAGYAAAATSHTLNLTGGTTAGNVSITGTGLLSTTINSSGGSTTGNVIGTLGLPATVTSATVNAATPLTTGAVTAAALTSLTVTGEGAVALGTTIPATVTTLNGSAMTGALTATLANVATQTVTLGSGNDVITTGGVLTTGSVAAGDGTDTLVSGTMANINTATLGAKYTGFETLRLTHATANTLNLAATLSGITAIELAGDATLTGLTATQAANIKIRSNAVDGTADAMSFSLATSSGTADVLTIVAGQGTTTTSATDIAALVANGFETINIQALAGPTSTAGAGGALDRTTTVSSITSDVATAINLTGTSFNIANAATTKATTIDASALTGSGLTVPLGLTLAGTLIAGSTVTGSDYLDAFTIGAEGSTYTGGAGNDTFTTTVAILAADGTTDGTIVGGDGTDTLIVSDTSATLVDNNFTYVSGMEKLTTSTGTTSITTGGSFNAAFASGVTIATGTLTDAGSFTYAGGLYNNAVTLTVDGTALLANAAGEDITITTGSSADTVTITGTTWVGAASAASGTMTISTGAGADTIAYSHGTLLATTTDKNAVITAGTGADSITKVGTNSTTVTAVSEFVMASGDSNAVVGGFDTITGFDISDGANLSDNLEFAGTAAVGTLATSTDFGTILSHSITAGVVLFDDASTYASALIINSSNLADAVGYLAANSTTAMAHAFVYDSDGDAIADGTMVYSNQATDSLVFLAGVTTVDALIITTNAAGANDLFVS